MELKIYLLCFIIGINLVFTIQNEEDDEWENYKITHGKKYSNELKRREVWSQNKKKIASLNSESTLLNGFGFDDEAPARGYTLKMNKYGDLTETEFTELLNGFKVPKHFEKRSFIDKKTELDVDFSEIDTRQIPTSLDWRKNGYVTPIKDQGYCGCCYVFSATAALEGQYAKNYGRLFNVSEQNFLNCVKNGYFVDYNGVVEPLQPGVIQAFSYSANGCNGGNADAVLQFAKFNGFVLQSNSPYKATVDICSSNPTYTYLTSATKSGFAHVYPRGNEAALINAVATIGPISVGIQGNLQTFQFYSSGIYSDPSCTSANINHAVTVIGYGSAGPGKDYYIIKNSWGRSWGMNGFGYIARNQGNMCGISSYGSYPLI